jgi:hypothetical protein
MIIKAKLVFHLKECGFFALSKIKTPMKVIGVLGFAMPLN